MRILHIIPDLPSGGAEMVVLTYLRCLNKEEDIRLVSLSSNQQRLYERIMEAENLPVDYLDQNIFDSSFIGRCRQIIQIKRYIKDYKPDVLHIHLSILWIVCLAIIGIKIPAIFHTLHSNPSKTSYGKNLYIDRWCYRLFDIRTICLNDEMASIANKIFKRKDTLVLPNGIDIERYKGKSKADYRKLLGLSDRDYLVGQVGRFTKVKNHHKTLTSFRELLRYQPNAKLVLVGEGEDRLKIEKTCESLGIKEKVIFTGARQDVPEIMKIFDVFIFPSFYEGLGIVLIEAQAANLRCVVSEPIPSEAIVTNHVMKLPLNASDDAWARALANIGFNAETPKHSIDFYDTNQVITTLMHYYINELAR